MVLRKPGRLSRLTLISPAGFGPDINAGYLRGFTEALAAIVACLLDGERSAIGVTAQLRAFTGTTVVVWGQMTGSSR